MLNDLYANEVSLFNNFFRPCVKLLQKERIGSKIKRKHSVAMTPYQRLMNSEHIDDATKAKLEANYHLLDPFKLQQAIQKKLKKIFMHVNAKDLHTRVAI